MDERDHRERSVGRIPLGADPGEETFRKFVADVEPRLRRAFIAAYGHDRGRDAAAEALAYAWENWKDVSEMANPAGYLYRVGRSRTRRPRHGAQLFTRPESEMPWVEPALFDLLARMPERQRVAVCLVHGYGFTYQETAELMGVGLSTAQKHVERGLARLQRCLGVTDDA
jgi:DNA-directed RNA polymerase specialized sigma24 family protein